MTLDRYAAPGKNFDLARSKLTLPSGKEISPQMLKDGYIKPDIFYTDPKTGGMVFECPNLAGTTTNSKYSRCELREMRAPQGDTSAPANNWTVEEGATIRARLRVDRVSVTGDDAKVGRVVFLQFHGPETEVARVYYIKKPDEPAGRIVMAMDDIDNNNTWSPTVMEDIPLGARFTAVLKVKARRLSLLIRYGGAMAEFKYVIDDAYRGKLCYSKAGNYNQQNTGADDDYARVTFYQLAVAHP